MSDSNLREQSAALLSLPRFGVSKLFGVTTLVCVLAAAAWWLSPMAYGVLLIVSGFFVVHVLGAVVGNRLRGDYAGLADVNATNTHSSDGELRVRS